MINYIIQVILFQVLFLAIYDFFLSKETFFRKNRWYLLSTPLLSFLIPLIKIPTFQQAVPQEYIVNLPELVLFPEKVIVASSWYQSVNYIDVFFGIGVIVFTVLFVSKLLAIINLIRTYKLVKKENYTLVLIPNQTKAFSFFNYIFLGKEIPDSQKEQIIAHELVHSKQKHSLDLLFFEVLKIVMWFNPMIFIYQKRITLIHEYISDEVATKSSPKENYINQLLSNFFQVENIAFINQFYKQTFIKKRITMMTKNKSKKMNQLKYLVLIPVLASMLSYTSCSDTVAEEVYAKKGLQTYYINMTDEMEVHQSSNESFLDIYLGKKTLKWKEISYYDLTQGEKQEFNLHLNEFAKKHKLSSIISYKLFKGENGRNLIGNILNNSFLREIEERAETKDVKFFSIEKAPTFPGCEKGDKDCFNKKIQKHFKENFNKDLPNSLGLSKGKKRIFIAFKVNTNGNVIDILARGPHLAIEEEVIRIMNDLPKMMPGEHKEENVAVSYNIPFVIEVK